MNLLKIFQLKQNNNNERNSWKASANNILFQPFLKIFD